MFPGIRRNTYETMGQGTSSKAQGKRDMTILIEGLYDAGKSTLLARLAGKDTPLETVVPASTIERSRHKDLVIFAWDVGGRDKVRPLYRHFYPSIDAMIFMVDNEDLSPGHNEWRLSLARRQLEATLSEEALPGGVPLLVVSNKQDLPGALSAERVWSVLGLESLVRIRAVEILPLSLETGEGLADVESWIDRQRALKRIQDVVVKPLKDAVPAPVTSASLKMSSALKTAFAVAKEKLLL